MFPLKHSLNGINYRHCLFVKINKIKQLIRGPREFNCFNVYPEIVKIIKIKALFYVVVQLLDLSCQERKNVQLIIGKRCLCMRELSHIYVGKQVIEYMGSLRIITLSVYLYVELYIKSRQTSLLNAKKIYFVE